jgi:DNA-binding NarL/FixJ family response regulator
VILTSYEDPRLTGRNLDHLPGNVRYLVKGELDDASTLSSALAASITMAATPAAGRSAIPEPTGDVARLTDTQIEVVRLVAEGLSNSEIARQRYISETSVERIIMRAARELDIPTTSASNRRVLLTRAYLRMSGASTGRD